VCFACACACACACVCVCVCVLVCACVCLYLRERHREMAIMCSFSRRYTHFLGERVRKHIFRAFRIVALSMTRTGR